MRLSDFILNNLEPILQAWEEFARSVDTPLPPLDQPGLRNHAEYILQTVALDMLSSQTSQEQIDKSLGLGPVKKEKSAAQSHAITRLVAGFTMDQMVSEYRALRSSVLRLWLAQGYAGEDHQILDMIRFNEAIDQALVESIAAYGRAVETTRKTVLGVLGHDLRTPLGAVTLGADLLRQTEELGTRGKKIISQISTSVQNANQMVNDLLDLARCNLGTGIPVRPENTDLTPVCRSVVEELTIAHPRAQIVFTATESVAGLYDPSRMAQVFSNLVGNAVRHGNAHLPIYVSLDGDGTTARFCVQNYGKPIPPGELPSLFNPEGRYSKYSEGAQGASSGLGLGLFIAAQIVEGHGGTIEVESTLEQGTIFRVILPVLK
ncbi:sensor histidine kinase [Pseudomonas sp. PCH199]|uniref:sensor histidine kinase n=1 Tax=unclassified Pseudomonas TaxID=196821 RepID=UPI000BC68E93|nr:MULTISPECIES: sensor histidine kinase [unclassified Pseudomonas]MCW8279264.1 sensor histidine kinase [Pseudomonas sp. PCH199]PAM78460.1 two-component sensor histidine kinase [Pseudomonas sp. ERMR1:02]